MSPTSDARVLAGSAGIPPEIAAALVANPADVSARLQLGAWLRAQCDPWGNLIAVQHAREGNPEDPDLKQNESDLLERHSADLLPRGLVDNARATFGECRLYWDRGFVVRARLAALEDVPAHELYRSVVGRPVAQLLRHLSFGLAVWPSEDEIETSCAGRCLGEAHRNHYGDVAKAIATLPPLAALETLTVGELPWDFVPDTQCNHLGDWSAALAALPRLQDIVFYGRELELGDIDLPALRTLAIDEATPANLASIARAHWPSLESLEVRCAGSALALLPLVDGTRVPSLARLVIMSASRSDDEALRRALAGSPLSARLREVSI